MSNVKAVKDYVVIDDVLTSRWFSQVPGFPGEFVVPQACVKLNCPNGFLNFQKKLYTLLRNFLFG